MGAHGGCMGSVQGGRGAWGAEAGGTWSFPGECGSVGVVES